MKRMSLLSVCVVFMLAALVGITACAGSGGSSSATNSSSSSSATSSSSSISSGATSSSSTAGSTATKAQPTATGTVVTTTYAKRAAEVGITSDDYKNDTGLLTLLVLDTPIQVTSYYGGSDYTGEVKVICLPNDEMFRQFSGKTITITAKTWGERPADISGKLYDIVIDFEHDGVTLAE